METQEQPQHSQWPCPYCEQSTWVVKAGINAGVGSQRLRCQSCRCYFTPPDQRKPRGYDPHLREQALKLALEGTSYRAIGRLLNVHHQSVANWVAAEAASLPQEVTDTTPAETVEIDELYTFVGKKRTEHT